MIEMASKGGKSRAGQYTGEIGEELFQELQISRPELGLEVFYDHGKMRRPKAVPHLGGKPGRASSLSHVDIAIAKGSEMIILCEIEEEAADPKKIIGDICNILLADSISVRGGRSFHFSKGFMILGLKTRSERSRKTIKAEALKNAIIARFPDKNDIDIIIISDTDAVRMTSKIRKRIMDIINAR
jgi:hypothetical protein